MSVFRFGGGFSDSQTISNTVQVSLGGLTHIKSNMYDTLTSKELRVDPTHPVVRDAMGKGKTFFVINSVYQSNKVEIKVDTVYN